MSTGSASSVRTLLVVSVWVSTRSLRPVAARYENSIEHGSPSNSHSHQPQPEGAHVHAPSFSGNSVGQERARTSSGPRNRTVGPSGRRGAESRRRGHGGRRGTWSRPGGAHSCTPRGWRDAAACPPSVPRSVEQLLGASTSGGRPYQLTYGGGHPGIQRLALFPGRAQGPPTGVIDLPRNPQRWAWPTFPAVQSMRSHRQGGQLGSSWRSIHQSESCSSPYSSQVGSSPSADHTMYSSEGLRGPDDAVTRQWPGHGSQRSSLAQSRELLAPAARPEQRRRAPGARRPPSSAASAVALVPDQGRQAGYWSGSWFDGLLDAATGPAIHRLPVLYGLTSRRLASAGHVRDPLGAQLPSETPEFGSAQPPSSATCTEAIAGRTPRRRRSTRAPRTRWARSGCTRTASRGRRRGPGTRCAHTGTGPGT